MNCGKLTESVSEYSGFHLKPLLQGIKSHIKDSKDFRKNAKEI